MHYEVKEIKTSKPLLLIPQKCARALGITRSSFRQVSLGERSVGAFVKPSRKIRQASVYASAGLLGALGLPAGVRCQLVCTKHGLALGPYIGILVSRHEGRLLQQKLKRLLPEAETLSTQGSIIVTFALDQVNRQAQTVTGWVYTAEGKQWQQVENLPYPAAIYRRIGLKPSWREHLLEATHGRLFNSYFWDKWELHSWVKQEAALALHVPETLIYSSWRDVLQMIDRFGAAFIKPATGMRGVATLLVQQESDHLLLRYNDGTCQVMHPEQAVEAIIRHCGERRYLVQRYIPLLNWRGGVVDFRVLMQKDDSLRWSCQGIIARVGSPGNIVSNISRKGQAYRLSQFAELAQPELGDKVGRWDEQLTQAGVAICDLIDKQGLNNGTIGLDIGIDRTGHWWLIEANNRDPDPSIAVDAGWRELYAQLRLNPLLYAKGLAGFRRRD